MTNAPYINPIKANSIIPLSIGNPGGGGGGFGGNGICIIIICDVRNCNY